MLKLFTKKNKKYTIDEEIHSVLCYMSTFKPDDEEYITAAKNLELLYKAKATVKSISPDVVVGVVGGLVSTVLVLYFEKTNVITSKIFNSVFRGRV